MQNTTETKTEIYPVLPLRDIVVFPSMVVPLFVGREKSVRALEEVVKREGKILLVTQKNGGVDDPRESDLYKMGTIGNILQLLRLPDGTVKVLVEGVARASIIEFLDNPDYFQVLGGLANDDAVSEKKEVDALYRTVLNQFEQYVKICQNSCTELVFIILASILQLQ